MMPKRELLSRIRWDDTFRRGEFQIGYYDRLTRSIVLKSLAKLDFPVDRPQVFEWVGLEGETHTVPLHRIKAVYRNGELIWQRTH